MVAASKMQVWFPAGVWLRNYNWGKNTAADLIAAVSVAALLIPESMGYASVAGVPAQIGLYAAPLALIGYALFGGSKLLVFGAAGSVAASSTNPGAITWNTSQLPAAAAANPPSNPSHVLLGLSTGAIRILPNIRPPNSRPTT